jgi:hypothetical protein
MSEVAKRIFLSAARFPSVGKTERILRSLMIDVDAITVVR